MGRGKHRGRKKPAVTDVGASGAREPEREAEVRQGGMPLQSRNGEVGPTMRIRVSHGPALRHVFVPAQATFVCAAVRCSPSRQQQVAKFVTSCGSCLSRLRLCPPSCCGCFELSC